MLDSTELNTVPAQPVADLQRLTGVQVDVSVELGRARMTLGQALEIGPGAVIALDRIAGTPLSVEINGQLVALGEVVVIDDVYGLRVTEIVSSDSQNAAGALGGLTSAPLESDRLAA